MVGELAFHCVEFPVVCLHDRSDAPVAQAPSASADDGHASVGSAQRVADVEHIQVRGLDLESGDAPALLAVAESTRQFAIDLVVRDRALDALAIACQLAHLDEPLALIALDVTCLLALHDSSSLW